MKAVFVIPTLISESVPYRLIPLLCKLIERNIATLYRNTFSMALQQNVRLTIKEGEKCGDNIYKLDDNLYLFECLSLMEADKFEERIERYKKQSNQLEFKLNQYKEEIPKLIKDKENIEGDIEKRETHIKEQLDVVKEKEGKSRGGKKITKEIDNIKSYIQGKENELQIKKNELRYLENKIAEYESNVKDIEKKYNETMDLVYKTGLDLDKYKSELDVAKTEHNKSKENLDKVKEIKSSVSQMLKDMRKAKKDSDDIRLKKAEFKQKMKEAKEKNEREAKERYEEKVKIDDTKVRRAGGTGAESIDMPTGVTFYKDIGLEPTLIEVSIGNQLYVIALKCIPYSLKSNTTENVLNVMMEYGRSGLIPLIRRVINSYWKNIAKKFPGKIRYIKHGRSGGALTSIIGGSRTDLVGENPVEDIQYAPDVYELNNYSYLAKRLRSKQSTTISWASTLIVTTDDIKDADVDMEHFFKIYKRLAKSGWGDVMVVDVNSEELHYCNISLLSCTKIPFSYLQKLFNLDNVLDFNELNRYAKGPFNMNISMSKLARSLS